MMQVDIVDIKMNILSVNFDDSILSFDVIDKILYDITTQWEIVAL